MAAYRFTGLTHKQVLKFNASADSLFFDMAGLPAAAGEFFQNGPDLWITYGDKTVKLANTTLEQISSAHFSFADGSRLLIGDDSPGTAADGAANLLTGTAKGDYLDGRGGADSLDGGDGNDVLVVPDLRFQRADGGGGTDTLVLSGEQLTLDLASLGAKLKNLEIIDLNGANTLNLNAAAVVALAGADGKLVVDGNSLSVANAGGGWTPGEGATADGHTYHTYSQQGATLWLDSAIAANINGVVALADLNGSNGFRLDGAKNSRSGGAVSTAGDVNGDGYDDLIIGTNWVGLYGGALNDFSYVVYGGPSDTAATLELSTLDGSNGFRLASEAVEDGFGGSVSAAGDVNGDGFGDLIIGAYMASSGEYESGSSYVLFGQAVDFPAVLDVSSLDGSDGFRLDGEAMFDFSGYSVSDAGDINGDGFGDLIVGAVQASPNSSQYSSGATYVVFGKASGFAATQDLAKLNGTNGFRLNGVGKVDFSGCSVSSAGDVNGDGFDDLIIGAHEAQYRAGDMGSSYVVFGKASGFAATVELSQLNGANGFQMKGTQINDFVGRSVSAAGDINGDGFGDVIVGGPWTSPAGKSYAGSSYVVFGKASGFAATLQLYMLDGSNGFRLDGGMSHELAGRSVSAAGDVNGDGFDDLLIGAVSGDSQDGDGAVIEDAGISYVMFGKASGFTSVQDLSQLNGDNGFRLEGTAQYERSGGSVSTAGDVNGDGFSDLIIGASGATHHGPSSGSSYVFYGGNFNSAVTQLGSADADSLAGSSANDRIVAGPGNDTIKGGGGVDVLYGGQGNDLISVAKLGFLRVDGGNGTDTLALAGAGQKFNLADFRNQLFGIEAIDLAGSGDNTLSFFKRDLLNLSDSSNTLRVDGNAGDHYHFADGGWVKGADVTLAGVAYHVYDNGAAHLLLNAALTAI